MEIGRLRWRCQRGSRELELMLLAYLERCYPNADAEEQAVFHRLLELPEDRLQDCLIGRVPPGGAAQPFDYSHKLIETEFDHLAKKIRGVFNAEH